MHGTALIDSENMRGLIASLPDHLQQGWDAAGGVDPRIQVSSLRNVVIGGMGGSAIGGDLLRTFVAQDAPVPVAVLRGYELPGYVNENTLFIASSYSGNTEETLAAFDAARSAGARIICVASGGEILRFAERHGLPRVQFPGGMPPRAALGYSLGALLRVASMIGLSDVTTEQVRQVVRFLKTEASAYEEQDSRPREIARLLKDHLPIVYSGTGLMEAVNLRWRGQMQENAKSLAFGNLYPELNHNEVMGWEKTPWLTSRIAVITLRDADDHPRTTKRMDILRDLIAHEAGAYIEVDSQGPDRLSRMLWTVQLGDWVSFYLAQLNEVDPTPIKMIDQFKDRLSGS